MNSSDKFYLPSLDGIRACAALLVYLSHAGWGNTVPGGFGVTVFFFLSGFLITTLLRREYEATGTLSFRHFYLRRAYRILPPMYLVLLGILGLGLAGLVPHNASAGGVLAQLLQVTNYYLLLAPDPKLVFATDTFWSLAVEEHFYILFPLLLLLCLRRWRYATVARVLFGTCAAVLLWRCVLVYGFHVPEERTYWATDTRLDSMLFGCILGLWRNPALDGDGYALRTKLGMLAAAAVLLALSFAVRGTEFRETWRYTLQGLACLPVFWLAVRHPHWPLFAPLNWAPLQLMGKVSYTFYLVHLFFIHVAEALVRGRVAVAATGFVLAFAFAYLVYRVVELPFARLRRQLHDA